MNAARLPANGLTAPAGGWAAARIRNVDDASCRLDVLWPDQNHVRSGKLVMLFVGRQHPFVNFVQQPSAELQTFDERPPAAPRSRGEVIPRYR
jgi:hypothetical protein